jgi:hypothetical protein
MTYTIPTPDGTKYHWQVSLKLDGVELVLEYKWNPRGEYWTIDIRTQAGEDLVTGQVLKPGKHLLDRSTSPNKPPGLLTVIWSSLKLDIPGLKSFAEEPVYLVYDDGVVA